MAATQADKAERLRYMAQAWRFVEETDPDLARQLRAKKLRMEVWNQRGGYAWCTRMYVGLPVWPFRESEERARYCVMHEIAHIMACCPGHGAPFYRWLAKFTPPGAAARWFKWEQGYKKENSRMYRKALSDRGIEVLDLPLFEGPPAPEWTVTAKRVDLFGHVVKTETVVVQAAEFWEAKAMAAARFERPLDGWKVEYGVQKKEA